MLRNLTEFTFHDYGLYAQGTYSLTDHLKLTGGFRYTWDNARVNANLFSYSYAFGLAQQPPSGVSCEEPGLTLPGCAVRYQQKSSRPTWLVDLDYKPTENILLYAKYARGYRAGGVAPNVPPNYATYEPEKLDAYEVGAKTSLRGPIPGTFDVSGFYNVLSSQQLLVLFNPKPGETVPAISGIVNAGRSRIAGLEANATITPFHGFTLDGAYTYLATKLRSIAFAASDPASRYTVAAAEQAGDPLPLSPKNKFTVTGTYTLPLDERIGKVAVAATFVHSDRYVTDYSTRNADGSLGPFDRVSPRNLLNLNLNWTGVAGLPVDLSLFATNVTNKHYYSFFNPLLGSLGFTSGVVGEPRMYGGRLRYRF